MKAVIFDADGTLIDSMSVWDNIGERYLIKNGIEPEADIDESIMTMSFEDSCAYFVKHYGIKKSAEQIKQEICDMVAEKYRSDIMLKDGVYEYIKKLKNLGVKLCVVTASERAYIEECLNRLGILEDMSFVMTCSEEGLDKNSHHIYDRARARLGFDLSDVVVFEDAFNAVEAAKQGGYAVYAVYDDSMREYTQRIKGVCDRYINTYRELI